MRLLLLPILGACTEYGIHKGDSPPADGDSAEDTGDPGVDSEETGDSPADSDSGDTDVTYDPCDGSDFQGWLWWGSPPFAAEADPTDGGGNPFYATTFDLAGWSTVALPDSGHCPADYDRAYRVTFELGSVPSAVVGTMESDDGMWLWINGAFVGHWGGDWQEEGCVNEDAACSETVTVDPVDLTSHLVAGKNVVAARVSNAIDNHYFDLKLGCAD